MSALTGFELTLDLHVQLGVRYRGVRPALYGLAAGREDRGARGMLGPADAVSVRVLRDVRCIYAVSSHVAS